jgi:hypothetical protein
VSKSKKKVIKKLAKKKKSCQKVVKKLSKSCQKVVKKLSLFSIIQCFLCLSIHDIGGFIRLTFNDVGRVGQKVLYKPSADSFAVGRRQTSTPTVGWDIYLPENPTSSGRRAFNAI